MADVETEMVYRQVCDELHVNYDLYKSLSKQSENTKIRRGRKIFCLAQIDSAFCEWSSDSDEEDDNKEVENFFKKQSTNMKGDEPLRNSEWDILFPLQPIHVPRRAVPVFRKKRTETEKIPENAESKTPQHPTTALQTPISTQTSVALKRTCAPLERLTAVIPASNPSTIMSPITRNKTTVNPRMRTPSRASPAFPWTCSISNTMQTQTPLSATSKPLRATHTICPLPQNSPNTLAVTARTCNRVVPRSQNPSHVSARACINIRRTQRLPIPWPRDLTVDSLIPKTDIKRTQRLPTPRPRDLTVDSLIPKTDIKRTQRLPTLRSRDIPVDSLIPKKFFKSRVQCFKPCDQGKNMPSRIPRLIRNIQYRSRYGLPTFSRNKCRQLISENDDMNNLENFATPKNGKITEMFKDSEGQCTSLANTSSALNSTSSSPSTTDNDTCDSSPVVISLKKIAQKNRLGCHTLTNDSPQKTNITKTSPIVDNANIQIPAMKSGLELIKEYDTSSFDDITDCVLKETDFVGVHEHTTEKEVTSELTVEKEFTATEERATAELTLEKQSANEIDILNKAAVESSIISRNIESNSESAVTAVTKSESVASKSPTTELSNETFKSGYVTDEGHKRSWIICQKYGRAHLSKLEAAKSREKKIEKRELRDSLETLIFDTTVNREKKEWKNVASSKSVKAKKEYAQKMYSSSRIGNRKMGLRGNAKANDHINIKQQKQGCNSQKLQNSSKLASEESHPAEENVQEMPPTLRRSNRVRIPPLRNWLNERVIYRRDSKGNQSAVAVKTADVDDPLYKKCGKAPLKEVSAKDAIHVDYDAQKSQKKRTKDVKSTIRLGRLPQ